MTLPEYSAQAENYPRGELYYRLRLAGMSNKAIAAKYAITEPSVRGQVSEYLSKARARKQTNAPAPMLREVKPLPDWQTYTYDGNTAPDNATPKFTGWWELEHEELMITGDIHVPSTNLAFLERCCRVAEKHMRGEKTLLICGDLLNGDKDNRKYPHRIPPTSRERELSMTEQLIDFLLGYFDKIKITPGNHFTHRLFETLEGDISMERIVRMLTSKTSRVEMSPYDLVYVTSGGQRWLVAHQYQYSRNKLIVADRLAQKHQTNTIAFHQHHTAKGMDQYGRYVIVDCGGWHDQNGMAYASLVPNTSPLMNNGVVFLRRGTAHLLSTHPAFTDWSMWLGESA